MFGKGSQQFGAMSIWQTIAEEVEKHVQAGLVLRPNAFKEKTKVQRVRP